MYEPWPRSDRQLLVCISICDTGSGIDPEHAKHLFEPFFYYEVEFPRELVLVFGLVRASFKKYGGSIR